MLRSMVAASALLLNVVAAPAQPAGPPWANKLFLPGITAATAGQPPPPVLAHNFGAVPQGTLCQHTFTLTNIYQVPLQVIDTTRGCACLVAYPPQRVLQPTESAEFTVTLDTRLLPAPGPSSRELKVTVGGQERQSTAVFRFEVDSRADVALSPGELALGAVPPGTRKAAEVVLDYQGRQPGWKVTGVVPGNGPVDVRVTPAGPNKYKLTAVLRATAPPGRFADRVGLTTTDPTLPVVQVPVSGTVLAPVAASPEVVQFGGPVAVGGRAEYAVLIRSGSNQPFRVRAVPDPGDGVSVEPFPAPAPTQRVRVRFEPTKPGPVSKELRLETDLPGNPSVVIRVEAVGQ